MYSGGQVAGRLHVQALQLRFQNIPPIPFCGAHSARVVHCLSFTGESATTRSYHLKACHSRRDQMLM